MIRKLVILLIVFWGATSPVVRANNATLVFLSCNQDVFEAGDSIKLFARVFNAKTEKPVPMADLFVMIKSLNGDIVSDARFFVEEGIANAKFKLPNWISNGFYTVVAFTRDAYENNNVRQLGIQHIYVFNRRKPSFYLKIHSEKSGSPENSILVNLALESLDLRYKLDTIRVQIHDYNGLLSQTSIPIFENQAQFRLALPSHFKKGMYLTFHSRKYNLIYKPYLLSVSKKDYSVEFYPEGGKMLTNSDQKIIYRCYDDLNQSVKLDGQIEDENGILVGDAKSIQAGLGRIITKPAINDLYYFIPSSRFDIQQKFQIPEIETSGVVITFHSIKNGKIEFKIFAAGKYLNKVANLNIRSKGEVIYSTSLQLKPKNLHILSRYGLPKGVLKAEIVLQEGVLSERLIYNQPPFINGMELENHFEIENINDSIAIKLLPGLMNQYFPITTYDLKVIPTSSHLFSNLLGTNSYLQKSMHQVYPGNVLELVLANMELIGNRFIADAKGSDWAGKQTVGSVVDRKGNKIAHAEVIGVNIISGSIFRITSDVQGEFRLVDIDAEEVTWKAFKDGRVFNVQLEHDFVTSLNDFLKTSIFNQMEGMNLIKVLPFTDSNFYASSVFDENEGSSRAYKNDLLELIKLIKPFYIHNNQIVFENQRASFIQSGALFVINERPMGTNIDILNALDLAKVLSVNIYSKLKDIERFTSINSIGVINIKTSENHNIKQLPLMKPFEEPYCFYNLKLNGKSINVNLPARNLKGSYQVIVDAVLENGQRIRTVKPYRF